MYGSMQFKGSPGIGSNPGNILQLLMQRAGGAMGSRGAASPGPEAEAAMARFLGLRGAPGAAGGGLEAQVMPTAPGAPGIGAGGLMDRQAMQRLVGMARGGMRPQPMPGAMGARPPMGLEASQVMPGGMGGGMRRLPTGVDAAY